MVFADKNLKERLNRCISRKGCVNDIHCRKEAENVLHEIMRRSRFNVEKIVAKLSAGGYEFVYPEDVLVFPLPNLKERIEQLERNGVFLPLSLKMWFEIVGAVNLMGSHSDWPVPAYLSNPLLEDREPWYTDPLVVEDSLLDDAFKNWQFRAQVVTEGSELPCRVEISPDASHKANISGGASYELSIQDPSVDTRLSNEPHDVNFVDYLRIAFSWGGFPGTETIKEFPKRFITELQDGLLPI